MNTSVTIGSSQEFRLSRALLVYGKSDYNGYPYRHPFLTVHEVVHESDGARLAEGQLVTPKMLSDLLVALGRSAPLEILPERVIVRTADTIVWWMPACVRTMFFSDRGGDAALKKMNGKAYPQPALVFKASGSHLWVRALVRNRRPMADTKMYMAPHWNCYDNGVVCTGTMTIPREKSVTGIGLWEKSFFESEFTHASGVRKHTTHPGGLLAMWQSLESKKRFPSRHLILLKQSFAEFVNDNDQSYGNANPGG
jgi:PRTRC genetic system protein B